MNIQGQFVSDEDRAVRRLIEQAQIILKRPARRHAGELCRR